MRGLGQHYDEARCSAAPATVVPSTVGVELARHADREGLLGHCRWRRDGYQGMHEYIAPTVRPLEAHSSAIS